MSRRARSAMVGLTLLMAAIGDCEASGSYVFACYLYTPKGSPVLATMLESESWDWSLSEKLWIIAQETSGLTGLVLQALPTMKYNCHAFAWASMNCFWVDYPEAYVLDGSYIKHPRGNHRTWGACGPGAPKHSSLVIDAGYDMSKWGAGSLYVHPPTVTPAQYGNPTDRYGSYGYYAPDPSFIQRDSRVLPPRMNDPASLCRSAPSSVDGGVETQKQRPD